MSSFYAVRYLCDSLSSLLSYDQNTSCEVAVTLTFDDQTVVLASNWTFVPNFLKFQFPQVAPEVLLF